MIHLIFESNRELNNRVFPIPKGIRKHLSRTLKDYNGDKTIDGYKRLNNLLEMDTVSYHELKRIKNFFDNYNGTDKSSEYILNGGDVMKDWVNNTLYTATKSIKNFKDAKKQAGFNNAFIRPHEKQRQIRKNKTTIPKIQTKDVAKKIGDNNSIRFENKERGKIIILSESQINDIFNDNRVIEELWKIGL